MYGSEVIIYTDNSPLSRMLTAKQTTADMSKLADLTNFSYTLHHHSGKLNSAADALSRNAISESITCQEHAMEFISSVEGPTFLPDSLVTHICQDVFISGITHLLHEQGVTPIYKI